MKNTVNTVKLGIEVVTPSTALNVLIFVGFQKNGRRVEGRRRLH